MDTTLPRPHRYSWPKVVPPLDAEQQRISDDFMRHWHEVLLQRYGSIEKFNRTYPTRFVPEQPHFRTLEIGARIGTHLEFEDLDRQEYHCVESRQNMASVIEERFPGVSVTVGDCQPRLPYDDGSFDGVTVVHVLEHLPDLPGCLREVDRLLRRTESFGGAPLCPELKNVMIWMADLLVRRRHTA